MRLPPAKAWRPSRARSRPPLRCVNRDKPMEASAGTEVTIWTQESGMFRAGGRRLESGPMTCIKLRRIMMPAIAAAIVTASACAASAQEADRTQPGFLDSLFGGSERLGGSERSAAPAQPGRVAQAGSDLIVRLDRLETQIRQLTGVIEQLQYRNQQL